MKKVNIILTIIILLSSLQPLVALAQTQDGSVIETNQTDNDSKKTIGSHNTSQTISTKSNNANSVSESLASITETTTGSSLTKAVTEDSVLQEENTTEKLSLLADVVASGTFGTSEWTIDVEGTLYIGEGTFDNNSTSWNKLQSPWGDYAAEIKKITFEGSVIAGEKSSYLFGELKNLTEIENLSLLDTSRVTDASSMFLGNEKLIAIDLSDFDTSNVTDMSSMFANVRGLTNLDLTHFDTSKVTNMDSMFFYASGLTSLNLSNFDTSKVTNMSNMFYQADQLTSLDLSNFNTSNVTDMYRMFFYTRGLTSLNLSNFDTSKVTNMNEMFAVTD